MSWRLPTSIQIGDTSFDIRTDFRDALRIFEAYNDPDLTDDAKVIVMLKILYPDADQIPQKNLQEAVDKGMEFLNNGFEGESRVKLMDWEQDADIIVPAVNKVAGTEVRALPYLHWWTFLGYYMEIGESLFSQVVNIRYKKAHNQKLEKWEKDFEKENKGIIKLHKKLTDEEKEQIRAEKQALDELIGGLK